MDNIEKEYLDKIRQEKNVQDAQPNPSDLLHIRNFKFAMIMLEKLPQFLYVKRLDGLFIKINDIPVAELGFDGDKSNLFEFTQWIKTLEFYTMKELDYEI